MTSAGTAGGAVGSAGHAAAEFFSRQQHFPSTGSTNDVVAGWLADGLPEVCLATADEQTRGRGRDGRTWTARPGSALLLSLGFRPAWLAPGRLWRLAAIVALAMADAAEEVAGLPDGLVRLKWPNDLVVEADAWPDPAAAAAGAHARPDPALAPILKLAGVLGESVGLGSDDPRVVIGIGINADWRREDFPPDLAATMTSLRDASHGRPVDRVQLLDAFLGRLEMRVDGLRKGHFAVSDWVERQVTTGRIVRLEYPGAGRPPETVPAVGVDADSGGLVVETGGAERLVHSAEVLHVRVAAPAGV